MRDRVDEILASRSAAGRKSQRRRGMTAGILAGIVHVGLGGAIALAPALAAKNKPPIQYTKVMIVPAKALGSPTAPPATERPPERPKPEEPKPAVAETETPDEPEPKPALSLEPSTRRSDPAPERTTRSSDSTASRDDRPSAPTQRRGGLDGTALGTSPFGSSEATLDDPSFRYGYYIDQMIALIGSRWVRPAASPGTECMIHFRVTRSGELIDIDIVSESGNAAFDLAAFRAVSLASPLPPLPQSYEKSSLGVNLIVR